jgi:TIR domain
MKEWGMPANLATIQRWIVKYRKVLQRRTRVFISYASEQCRCAEKVKIKLEGADYHVFFDRDDLKPGKEYDTVIQREIGACDLFLFLISRNSLASGSFCLNELDMARKRWRHPDGHLLPVRTDDTPLEEVEPYLTAVGILQPRGDFGTAVASAVADVIPNRQWALNRTLVGLLAAVTAAVLIWLLIAFLRGQQWCVTVTPRMDGKHTQCFATQEECLKYEALAMASLAHTPYRKVIPCRLMIPLN